MLYVIRMQFRFEIEITVWWKQYRFETGTITCLEVFEIFEFAGCGTGCVCLIIYIMWCKIEEGS